MNKCPFCGALKDPYQPSPAFIKYDCGTEMYRHLVDYVRKDTCYMSEIIELQTKLANQTALLREAQNAINNLTGFRECIYDCSIVPTYQESEAAANAVVIKIDEELRKIK